MGRHVGQLRRVDEQPCPQVRTLGFGLRGGQFGQSEECVLDLQEAMIAGMALAKAIGGSHNLIAELFTDTGVGTLVRGES